MPLPQDRIYTSEDYWNLPDGDRAELIGGNCEVIPAPFAVNLDAENNDWVEPDISVVCDKAKLTDRGCSGAPDLIIEIVSPSSRRMDYTRKNGLYADAGVREYWIVDPVKRMVTIYFYQEDDAPAIYSFDQAIPVGIYGDLTVTVSELILGS